MKRGLKLKDALEVGGKVWVGELDKINSSSEASHNKGYYEIWEIGILMELEV